MTSGNRLQEIEQAIRDYHLALDNREHGGVAASAAIMRVEKALGLSWEQNVEKNERLRAAGELTAEKPKDAD
jgi:hypothetical protein